VSPLCIASVVYEFCLRGLGVGGSGNGAVVAAAGHCELRTSEEELPPLSTRMIRIVLLSTFFRFAASLGHGVQFGLTTDHGAVGGTALRHGWLPGAGGS
jgi:hypothetical protein